MAARYFTLVADERWLAGVTPLNATRQEAAEEYADDIINVRLIDWDRTTWGGTSSPPEILRAAELLASGRYRQMDYSSIRRGSSDEDNDPGKPLIREAMDILDEIDARGWLLDASDEKVTPEDTSPAAGGLYLDIQR